MRAAESGGHSPRVDGIDHVELYVPDRREAAGWYEQALGLTAVAEYEGWAEDPRGPLMISSDRGRTMLALFDGEPERERPAAGFRRVAFRVGAGEFVALRRHLENLPVFDESGDTLSGVTPVDHDGSFSVYFCDPWGHPLEVTTYDYAEVADILARAAYA